MHYIFLFLAFTCFSPIAFTHYLVTSVGNYSSGGKERIPFIFAVKLLGPISLGILLGVELLLDNYYFTIFVWSQVAVCILVLIFKFLSLNGTIKERFLMFYEELLSLQKNDKSKVLVLVGVAIYLACAFVKIAFI